MRKVLIGGLILAQLLLQSAVCYSAGTSVGTFTLMVTIPAIVGLNVPDPDEQFKSIETKLIMGNTITSNTQTDFTEIKTVRNYQNITLRTLVVR